ncbi:MAG: hypothetical protein ACI8RZ_004440 [Myxococcota bacterium]|jgi:hypothetical protein
MDRSSVDIMAQLMDLVVGLHFDDLGSESAAPLHSLLVLPAETMADFSPKHEKVAAVLEELVAVNGTEGNAPALVALLSSLASLELWVGVEGVERPVWLIGTASDGGRVGVATAVVWT